MQSYISDAATGPLVSTFRDLEAMKMTWKQKVQERYAAYRDDHDNNILKTHHALLETGVPKLASIEQSLRYCSRNTDPAKKLNAMTQLVDNRAVHEAWDTVFRTAKTGGYPVPRLFIPSKLIAALEMFREGLSEIELSFDEISECLLLGTLRLNMKCA